MPCPAATGSQGPPRNAECHLGSVKHVQGRLWPRQQSHCRVRHRSSARLSAKAAASRDDNSRSLFCFGLGYVGTELSRLLISEGWRVSGTMQPGQKADELSSMGAKVFVFDTAQGQPLRIEGLQALRSSSHILSTIPPVEELHIDPVLLAHEKDIKALSDDSVWNVWIGYLSSTGVYGDWKGEWVDESFQPQPATNKLRIRLNIEEQWQALPVDSGGAMSVRIFRLGGIYGPGRNAFVTVKKGSAVSVSQRQRGCRIYTSRVHVYDVCQALKASMELPCPSDMEIYNVVDDDPASRAEVMQYARALLAGQDAPAAAPDAGFCDEQPVVKSAAPLNKSVDEKRVKNMKMKSDLGVTLMYPTFREGLQSIARDESLR